MPILTAENYFLKGLAALSQGNPRQANTLFKAAMKIERDRLVTRPQMRYLSYYGLSLAMAKRPTRKAIKACETAAFEDFHDPNLLLNLGKVYMMAGKKTLALTIFEQGLLMAPDHRALTAELAGVDRRSSPTFSWLSRSHPLNHWTGRLRSGLMMAPPKRTVCPPSRLD